MQDRFTMADTVTRRRFMGRLFQGVCAFACPFLTFGLAGPPSASAQVLKKGAVGRFLSPYYAAIGNKTIRCELCPHQCEVGDGARGLCDVRQNIDGKYYSLVYGNPCAVNVDPVEKKPFYHVLPTTRSFSLATAGCNFDCKFCQNWEISQARPEDTYNYLMTPEQVVELAARYGCASIASTYVEPTVFMEYMLAIGKIAKEKKMLKVMHSNGFVNNKPLNDLCQVLDAACIDLKGFTEAFYKDITEGDLEPVLDTIKQLRLHGIHTEIVNLVIPGRNDDINQIHGMCQWIRQELGSEVPLHFIRFYPRYKLKSLPPTPVSVLEAAHKAALEEGLRFVYIGNVPEHPADHTYCPQCKKMLIKRIGYNVKVVGMKKNRCAFCGYSIPGIWEI